MFAVFLILIAVYIGPRAGRTLAMDEYLVVCLRYPGLVSD